MGVDDRLVDVSLADVRPHDRIEAELEEVRRRGGVFGWDVLDGNVLLEQEEAAGLVRELGAGVLADGGWKYLSADFWDAPGEDVESSMESTVWW